MCSCGGTIISSPLPSPNEVLNFKTSLRYEHSHHGTNNIVMDRHNKKKHNDTCARMHISAYSY